MLPIRKILCPTDFSEPSYLGLETANEIAVHFSSELILVHVIPPAHHVPGPGIAGFDVSLYIQEMNVNSQKSLSELVKNRIDPKITSQTIVTQGNAANQIVNLAASQKADLIVIATHGLSGFKRFIFGSVAEKVVRNALCPVITVPGPQEEDDAG
jgi:nucleotide-binding universal stress UspA family protein